MDNETILQQSHVLWAERFNVYCQENRKYVDIFKSSLIQRLIWITAQRLWLTWFYVLYKYVITSQPSQYFYKVIFNIKSKTF